MEWWAVAVVVLALATRPVEAHLWRAGRLSDRALTLLLVGRFPLLVGLFAVTSGAPLQLTVLVVAISLVPTALMYPLARDFNADAPRRANGG